MKDERYNKVFFERAFALRDTDPFEAERLMRVYLYDYPNDRSKLGLYASLLVIIGDFTNAERVLAVIENFLYNLVPEKNPTFYRNILYTYHVTYLKLLIATGRYQEYIDYYESVKDELESINVKINIKPAYLYCRRKLGKFVRESVHRENYSYSIRQAAEYKEDEFIEHIEKHMADESRHTGEANQVNFNSDFPLQEILKEIKKYIPSNKALYYGSCDATYFFKFDNCGRVNFKNTDYFKVVVFAGSSEIITMHPCHAMNVPMIDLNYLREKKNDEVNRPSQIEKFNKRFRRNG